MEEVVKNNRTDRGQTLWGGLRCEVGWLRIENEYDEAIEIRSPGNFDFSITHFAVKDY